MIRKRCRLGPQLTRCRHRAATVASCALAWVALLAAGAISQGPKPAGRPLVVGSEENFPPFATGSTDGTAGGFTVDLWKAVAAERGLDYTIRVRPFHQILDEFKAGSIDVLINLAQSDERRAFADFSVPHVIVNGAIFVRNGTSAIRSEADLPGKSIIVINGDLAQDYAATKGWAPHLVPVATVADGMRLLASGRHDAMLVAKLTGIQTLRELAIRNVKPLQPPAGFSQRFSFAVKKGDADLLATLNEGLALAKSNGTYDALYEKSFSIFDPRGIALRHLMKYLGPGAFAAVILIGALMVRRHERKEAEHRLRESQARFQRLIEHAPEAIVLLDLSTGCFIEANSAAERLFKLSADELRKVGPLELSPPIQPDGTASADKGAELIARAAAGETPVFEWIHRDSENREIPCEVRLLRIDISGRTVVRGSVTDITERRRAEQERTELLRSLEASQVRLETLVGNLPGMAYRCQNDLEWTMTYVSDGCHALTGWRREELENNRAVAYGELVHPEDRDWLWEKCQASLDARTPCQNEYRIINRNGRVRWVSERASGVYGEDGALLFIDGFIQDITAARQAEIEREQIDRRMQETQKLESLGVLAGGIAHDFNNLLTSVLGNASIALGELPAGSLARECVEQITEASQRAADLCKQMLAYSGRGRFVVQKLDLGQLVEQTAQMLQISISKKAALRFSLEKGLPPIEADATQMRQVIMNLVINASEAIGDRSGTITLTTGLARLGRGELAGMMIDADLAEGDYVFLEVADTGSGMSAETRARIFDPFFTTKFTGRGLGLAAVLGIVRGHKGAMKVESEPGRGTAFKLFLPKAAGASESAPAPPAGAGDWRGHGTVLVVDDEEAMRSTVARMMRLMNLDPVLAVDGRDAVALFSAKPARYDLVLLDLTMPEMDGEQTFAELRRLRPDVRVVLMSGYNAQEALGRFNGKGLASFLQKPFTIADLGAVLRGVLG
jgi:PAS domain S-box-containing protein